MKKNLFVLLLVLSSLLVGCQQAKYQDASATAQFSGLVGGRFQTTADLIVHGVRYNKGRGKTIQEFVVTNKPGFDGPEVVITSVLKPGAIIRIKRALICTNCIGAGIKFDIEIHPTLGDSSIPVSLIGIGKSGVTTNQDGRTVLTPSLFVRR